MLNEGYDSFIKTGNARYESIDKRYLLNINAIDTRTLRVTVKDNDKSLNCKIPVPVMISGLNLFKNIYYQIPMMTCFMSQSMTLNSIQREIGSIKGMMSNISDSVFKISNKKIEPIIIKESIPVTLEQTIDNNSKKDIVEIEEDVDTKTFFGKGDIFGNGVPFEEDPKDKNRVDLEIKSPEIEKVRDKIEKSVKCPVSLDINCIKDDTLIEIDEKDSLENMESSLMVNELDTFIKKCIDNKMETYREICDFIDPYLENPDIGKMDSCLSSMANITGSQYMLSSNNQYEKMTRKMEVILFEKNIRLEDPQPIYPLKIKDPSMITTIHKKISFYLAVYYFECITSGEKEKAYYLKNYYSPLWMTYLPYLDDDTVIDLDGGVLNPIHVKYVKGLINGLNVVKENYKTIEDAYNTHLDKFVNVKEYNDSKIQPIKMDEIKMDEIKEESNTSNTSNTDIIEYFKSKMAHLDSDLLDELVNTRCAGTLINKYDFNKYDEKTLRSIFAWEAQETIKEWEDSINDYKDMDKRSLVSSLDAYTDIGNLS